MTYSIDISSRHVEGKKLDKTVWSLLNFYAFVKYHVKVNHLSNCLWIIKHGVSYILKLMRLWNSVLEVSYRGEWETAWKVWLRWYPCTLKLSSWFVLLLLYKHIYIELLLDPINGACNLISLSRLLISTLIILSLFYNFQVLQKGTIEEDQPVKKVKGMPSAYGSQFSNKMTNRQYNFQK